MQVERSASLAVFVFGFFVAAACGDDSVSTRTRDETSDSGGTDQSTSAAQTSAATGSEGTTVGEPDGSYPEGCEEQTSPFRSQICAKALEDWCRPLDREACETEPWLSFEDGAYSYACGWATVYTFEDVSSCEGASVSGRCEAGIFQTVGCDDECNLPPGGSVGLYTISAIPNADELVKMPCAPGGGILDGPTGEWTALSYQEEHGPGSVVTPCNTNGLAEPPQICSCLDAACTAAGR